MSDFVFPINSKFELSEKFIENYKGKQPEWGPLGYVVYKRTYSRIKPNGEYEEFWETLKRVVEGCYTIQLNHCKNFRLPWNAHKAQKSAQRMYDLMWNFKFLPPGRMLWALGSDVVWKKGAASLLNCAAVSTEDLNYDFSGPFCWVMDMSMFGVGVGFDTKGANKVKLQSPKIEDRIHVISDDREGWVEAIRIVIDSYVGKSKLPSEFDFSQIRPIGSIIKTFGGIAPGPDPLITCIEELKSILNNRIDQYITATDIVDIMNVVGKCVVSGGIRRTALLALGDASDKEYTSMKDPNKYSDLLMKWRWASNNSVYAMEGMDYTDTARQTIENGEPGYVYIENIQKYGRLKDGVTWADKDAIGVNPCVTGDTLVAVADGRGAVSIKQLTEENKDVPVYSVNPEGKVEIKMGRNPRITGYNMDLLEVILDDDSSIKVTPNHKFLLKDGSIKEAKDLNKGDSLQRFTKRTDKMADKSKQSYLYITNDIYNSKSKKYEHRMISEFYNKDKWNEMYKTEQANGWCKGGIVVHHKDYNGLNNRPENLELMTFKEHQQYHADHDCNGEKNGMYGKTHTDYTKKLIGEKTKERCQSSEYVEFLKERISNGMNNEDTKKKISNARKEYNKEWYLEFEKTTDLKTIWIDDKLYVKKNCEACNSEMTLPVNKRETCFCSKSCGNKSKIGVEARRIAQAKKFEENSLKTKHMQIMTYKDLQQILNRNPMRKEWEEKCKENNISFRFNKKSNNPNIFATFDELKEEASTYNHRVKEVRKLDYKENVYNITVDDNHTVGYITTFDRNTNVCDGIFTPQCGEQSLENYELCLLCELFPSKHENQDEFMETIKYAYLLAKTVTLIPTHCERSNQVMLRNRRIGLSLSGIVDAMEKFGKRKFLIEFCDKGYNRIKNLDEKYSRWLCVPKSIKKTTVKPSGSVALLPGVSPGIHYPHSEYYIRRIEIQKNSPLVERLEAAGYRKLQSVYKENSFVFEFPIKSENYTKGKNDATIWEQMALHAAIQYYWSDNNVSQTVTFNKLEENDVKSVLEYYEDKIKAVSFLPLSDHSYAQAPYETISNEEYELRYAEIKEQLDFSNITISVEEDIEQKSKNKFCDGDSCQI